MIHMPDAEVWKRALARASSHDSKSRSTASFDSRMDARRIVVIGVGGAGVNTVARLADAPAPGVSLMAVDTSAQTLLRVGALDPTERTGGTHAEIARTAQFRIRDVAPLPADRPSGALASLLLTRGTRGLGTGGDAAKAARAALADDDAILAAIKGAGIVFVVAGLAGGTGGGAAPVIARLARQAGAVTLGFGILPFAFESSRRLAAASSARDCLRNACHTTVDLDNGRAVALAGRALSLEAALRVADDAVRQAVGGLGELIGAGGWIDVDVARALEVLRMPGLGCVALGAARIGDGENHDDRPVISALRKALESPLGGMCGLSGARSAMIQVCAGPELAIADVADAAEMVKRRLPAGADLFVGAASRAALRGVARVMLLGTGIGSAPAATMGAGGVQTESRWPGSSDTGTGLTTSNGDNGRPPDQDRHDPRRSARDRITASAPAYAAARAI